jgi:hypothetical protein
MSITDFLVTQASLDGGLITLAPSLGNVKLVFSEGVTNIPADSFKNQTQVVAVEFPDSLQSIGSSAFEGCTGLTSVTLPSGVISVDANAFKGCIALKSLDARALETKAGEPLHITTDKFAIVNNTINDVWVPNADDTVCSTNKKVGIGTNAPATELHLYTSNKNEGAHITLEGDGGSGGVPTVGLTFKTNEGIRTRWLR